MTEDDSRPNRPAVAAFPVDPSRASDEELAALAARNPEASDRCFDEIYRRYGTKVQNWCRRVCGDAALAEDAAQEVFLKLQRNLHTFRGDSRFSTWLYVMARRSTLNFIAARRHQSEGSSLDDSHLEVAEEKPSADQELAQRELQDKLRDAIQNVLSPAEARVVVLHCLHGLTLPAITRMLELDNRSGAKALFVAAKRRLRGHFARELSELLGPSEE